MPAINPEVTQWIGQMGDRDQVVACFAYQSLLEQVLHTSAPDRAGAQTLLAAALGQALTARPRQGSAPAQVASFGDNPFLAAVASQAVEYRHAARVRVNLARLLGYIPHEAAVPFLAQALEDLEARDMARCSLECHPSEKAVDALIAALNSVGAVFRVGVVNSLAKRKGERVAAALRRVADDPQPEVRMAALEALADVPDPAHDGLIERGTRSASPEERRRAQIARVRLAANLLASGDRQNAARIYRAILAGDAEVPQKKAAKSALQGGPESPDPER
ncbi:MAG: HEAT repeat domain-containing protein [Bryobacteraceae bacterium]